MSRSTQAGVTHAYIIGVFVLQAVERNGVPLVRSVVLYDALQSSRVFYRSNYTYSPQVVTV